MGSPPLLTINSTIPLSRPEVFLLVQCQTAFKASGQRSERYRRRRSKLRGMAAAVEDKVPIAILPISRSPMQCSSEKHEDLSQNVLLRVSLIKRW